jgi:3-oxoacyl-[acyl-carrier-protein] synthase II
MPRVFVTGMGVVSPVGIGLDAFWEALVSGRSGADEVRLFDTSTMDRHRACEVKDFRPRDFLSAAEARHAGRCSAFAIAAAREAVRLSGIAPKQLAGERTAVILGTTMGEANILGELEAAWIHQGEEAVHAAKMARYGTTLLPIHVARAFGARGMVQTLPAACAAGNYAIGFAADQIRSGRADVAITGATEILEKLEFAGFVRLGAVAPEMVQPFDRDRKGLLLGEGAGMFVLESEAHMMKRGATPLAEVGGYGLACDAHHITRPHPEGEGSAKAMRRAIEASGITPREVDFINAHGTATQANDLIEARVIHAIFEGKRVAISSNKSIIGHCMGAASAIEAVACIKTLETGILPPTINLANQDPACEVDVVANAPRTMPEVKVVLNNALAFGGYDAVLALARPGTLPETVGLS